MFVDGALFGFCGSIAHKSDIGGPVPGSCSGQARETFNEGLHLPAVRYHRKGKPIGDIERIIGANSRTPELVLGDIRGQLGSDRLGERRLDRARRRNSARRKFSPASTGCSRLSEAKLRKTFAEWKDGRFEAERFVDDDGIDLEKPVRIHVVVEKKGDSIHFDFSGSADQTKGPANVRPPLVQAACAYCLISLIDPATFVSQGLLRAFTVTAREGSVLNPRFPAPVNTYNPTVHALVDAVYDALVQHRARQGARRRLRQPLHHPRRAHDLYRQGLRAIRDHRRRRRRARHQGRRVGHHRQSEQRHDRAGRDHRKRISDPHPALRADREFRRRRAAIAAGSASAANISISKTRASPSAR